jgi:hypothetical protein
MTGAAIPVRNLYLTDTRHGHTHLKPIESSLFHLVLEKLGATATATIQYLAMHYLLIKLSAIMLQIR